MNLFESCRTRSGELSPPTVVRCLKDSFVKQKTQTDKQSTLERHSERWRRNWFSSLCGDMFSSSLQFELMILLLPFPFPFVLLLKYFAVFLFSPFSAHLQVFSYLFLFSLSTSWHLCAAQSEHLKRFAKCWKFSVWHPSTNQSFTRIIQRWMACFKKSWR